MHPPGRTCGGGAGLEGEQPQRHRRGERGGSAPGGAGPGGAGPRSTGSNLTAVARANLHHQASSHPPGEKGQDGPEGHRRKRIARSRRLPKKVLGFAWVTGVPRFRVSSVVVEFRSSQNAARRAPQLGCHAPKSIRSAPPTSKHHHPAGSPVGESTPSDPCPPKAGTPKIQLVKNIRSYLLRTGKTRVIVILEGSTTDARRPPPPVVHHVAQHPSLTFLPAPA